MDEDDRGTYGGCESATGDRSSDGDGHRDDHGLGGAQVDGMWSGGLSDNCGNCGDEAQDAGGDSPV